VSTEWVLELRIGIIIEVRMIVLNVILSCSILSQCFFDLILLCIDWFREHSKHLLTFFFFLLVFSFLLSSQSFIVLYLHSSMVHSPLNRLDLIMHCSETFLHLLLHEENLLGDHGCYLLLLEQFRLVVGSFHLKEGLR
jgi:hypothetical protein